MEMLKVNIFGFSYIVLYNVLIKKSFIFTISHYIHRGILIIHNHILIKNVKKYNI